MYNIAVIGGGIVGVTSAFALQETFGFQVQVTIYTDKQSPHTTGDVSAGLWSPYLLGSTPSDKIGKWGKATHNFFHKLWLSGFANESGISLQYVSRVNIDENASDFTAAWMPTVFGCEKMSEWQLNLLNKEHASNYRNGYNFVTFTCEPTKFIPFIMKKIIKNGGRIIEKRIDSFEELTDYNFIVNCTGLFAKYLCNDNKMLPIRGQICRVKAPWQYHVLLDDNHDGHYVIPNTDYTILGGTHQENDPDLNIRLSDKTFILSGCYNMHPGLKSAKVIKDQVGLRPGRDFVRLEMEMIAFDGKEIYIFHNYGHGGSGVTLCYGCGLDVSKLIYRYINKLMFKTKL